MDVYGVRTCIACPEQYDVFIGDSDVPIGYIRLRWGYLRADYLPTDTTVYTADFHEEYKGQFSDDTEREKYLLRCYAAIEKAHKERNDG